MIQTPMNPMTIPSADQTTADPDPGYRGYHDPGCPDRASSVPTHRRPRATPSSAKR
jgi:hypothetical protein